MIDRGLLRFTRLLYAWRITAQQKGPTDVNFEKFESQKIWELGESAWSSHQVSKISSLAPEEWLQNLPMPENRWWTIAINMMGYFENIIIFNKSDRLKYRCALSKYHLYFIINYTKTILDIIYLKYTVYFIHHI